MVRIEVVRLLYAFCLDIGWILLGMFERIVVGERAVRAGGVLNCRTLEEVGEVVVVVCTALRGRVVLPVLCGGSLSHSG